MEKIIEECINYGSLYYLLDSNKIEHDKIYNYLKEKNYTLYIEVFDLIKNKVEKTNNLNDQICLIKAHKYVSVEKSVNILIRELLHPKEINEEFITKLLKYFSYISTTSYWNIIKPYFVDYIKDLNILNYNLCTYQLLTLYFDEFKIIKLNDKYIKILEYDNYIIAYLLGFNINNYIPSNEKLTNILNNFDKDTYFNNIYESNKKYLNNLSIKKIINDRDDNGDYINTFYEPIYKFNLYDVFIIETDDFIYIYTIDEIKTLIRTKLHFKTRITIDNFIINKISMHKIIGNYDLKNNWEFIFK